jgi:hypothetical protein
MSKPARTFNRTASSGRRATSSENTGPEPAASYARKSTADDMGLKAQHMVNVQKAAADEYVIPDDAAFRFEDDDTSGRRTSREDLDRLIAVITSGKAPFRRVYVKDKTREGRFSDPRFHFFLQVLFEQHGVKLCYSDRDVQLDFSSGDPRDMFGLLVRDLIESITSSQELATLIKRVTDGSRIWVVRGFYPGNRAPYGLERWYADEQTGQLLERVVEGAVVKQKGRRFKLRFAENGSRDAITRIFDALEEGASLSETTARLNLDGVPAPGGGTWYPEAVRRIARNPIYKGTLIWGRGTRAGEPVPADRAAIDGREAIVYADFVPDAPITPAQFDRVQRLLDGNIAAHNQRRRNAPAYPLSGVVVCEVCGGSWHGFTSTKKYRSRRRYYRHGATPKAHVGTCPNANRYVRANAVEEPIEALVEQLLRDNGLVTATRAALDQLVRHSRTSNHEAQAAELTAQLEAQIQKFDKLVEDRAEAMSDAERDACQRGVDRANRRVKDLRQRLEVHTTALERAARLQDDLDGAATRTDNLLPLLDAGTPADRRAVYAELFPRILVHPDVQGLTVEIHPLT